MQNKLLVVGALCGLMAVISARADENWTCSYDGTWDTFDNSAQGVFNWHVLWQGNSNDNWIVTGDYSDSYGESTLNGNCDDDSCRLHQVYSSGELEGKQYYWQGEYTDDVEGTTSTNNFTGTWGATPDANDGGNWKAVATCVRS